MGISGENPLEVMVDQFCQSLRRSDIAEVTVRNYRSDWNGVINWRKGRSLGPFDFQTFLSHDLPHYRDFLHSCYRKTTVNRKLASIRSFMRWASEQGLLNEAAIPAGAKVSETSLARRCAFLTRREIGLLFAQVRSSGNQRDQLVLLLMVRTGLRKSEVLNLRWREFHIEKDVAFLKFTPPGQKAAVVLLLSTDVRNALESFAGAKSSISSDYVFTGRTGRMTERWIEKIIERHAHAAGLDFIQPRMLRNTYLMNLVYEPDPDFLRIVLEGLLSRGNYTALEQIADFNRERRPQANRRSTWPGSSEPEGGSCD
jgi:site-specific recombinase XerD